MHVEEHGGSCCGIRHIYHFPLETEWSILEKKKQLDLAVQEALLEYYDEDCGCGDCRDCNTSEDEHLSTWTLLCEVVLVDGQLPEWEKIVTDKGFKEVTAFKNSNSGNVCHVFHYVTNS